MALEWGECPWGCLLDFMVGGSQQSASTLEFIKASKYYQCDSTNSVILIQHVCVFWACIKPLNSKPAGLQSKHRSERTQLGHTLVLLLHSY